MPRTHTKLSVQGGFRAAQERQARLAQPAATPQTIRPMPAPDPEQFRRLAADKRREAAGILRHVQRGDTSTAAKFARKQATELLRLADEYEAQAGGGH